MKRSPLPRSTKPLSRKTQLARCKPLPRKRRKPKPGDDPARLRWTRRQPCCACGHAAPNHAHHPRHGVGMAQKAPDSDAIALCASDPRTGRLGCHDALHRRQGRFRHMAAWQVMCWEMARIAEHQERYALYRAQGERVA